MSDKSNGAMIQASHLSKFYGSFVAIQDISFSIPKGQIVAFLGPNGAGKTTTMKILSGFLAASEGRASIAGFDVFGERLEAARRLGYLPENGPLYDDMTPSELLAFFGNARGIEKKKLASRIEEVSNLCALEEVLEKPIGKLSKGYRQRVGLAQALLHNPDVLIMDEPTAGLDPRSRLALWSVIKELVKEGVTMLLTTQYLEEADHLADRMVILNRGKVIAEGTSDELKSRVGGSVLELRLGEPRELQQAVKAISGLTDGGIQSNSESGIITIPVVDGTSILVSAIRRLDEAGVKVSGIELRKPTLDEAFLSLTGEGGGRAGLKEVV